MVNILAGPAGGAMSEVTVLRRKYDFSYSEPDSALCIMSQELHLLVLKALAVVFRGANA